MAETVGWTFGQRLAGLREAKGLTKYALAKLTGLTKQAISRIESEGRSPTWDTVQLLAKALGVTCEAFNDPGLALPPPAEKKPLGRPKKTPAAAQGETSASKAASAPVGQKKPGRGKRKGG